MMRCRTSVAGLIVVLLCAQANDASARRCADNPQVPSSMMTAIGDLWPYWLNGVDIFGRSRKGIRSLFNGSPLCMDCHALDAPASTAQLRYVSCGSCHDPNNAWQPADAEYPDWLNFYSNQDINGNPISEQPLYRRSYYSPGLTKAEAALIRAKDGTMSPGAAAYDDPSAGNQWSVSGAQVGWCEEIITVYQQWLNAGMPTAR